jgi:predicted transcriptional regulator
MEVQIGCGSDLMSDVLAFLKPSALLLTGLTNPQSIRTAEMADVVAVCYVRGKRPNPETVTLAQEKEIPVLVTGFTMFEACGRLYTQGLAGGYD